MNETIINEPGNVQGMPPVREIKEGSVVRLKSGGPLMTVANIVGRVAYTKWFVGHALDHSDVTLDALKLEGEEDPKVKEIREYLCDVMAGFEHDPPDSAFQEGYDSAVCSIYGDLFMTPEERAELFLIQAGTLGHLDLSQPEAPRSESNNNGQAVSGTVGTVGTGGWDSNRARFAQISILAIFIIACFAIGSGLLR